MTIFIFRFIWFIIFKKPIDNITLEQKDEP